MIFNTNDPDKSYASYEKNMKSEGKLLEILVTIEINLQPYLLPPVIYQVPNWLLGYEEWHVLSTPQMIYVPAQAAIRGTNNATLSIVSFAIRVLEDSPSFGVQAATIDAAAVQQLLDMFRSVNRDL